MSEFIIREGVPGDVEAQVALYIAVASEGRWIGGELPLDRDELIARRAAGYEDPDRMTFVAEADGVLIGEIGLEVRRGRADIGMEIADAWRGRGVGTALMDAAITWARSKGLDKLFLQVWPHNERAIALYEKVGFVREGYHPRQYRRKNGEAWDAVSMGLVL